MAAKFEMNKEWAKKASEPIKVRKGASEKEIEAELKKQLKKRGLTK
ncbi:hypothetical protein GS942_23855 [Rhodococcus hoagii]|nr:hypothetical protein [Prescottella equi]NKW34923.1 hypothetical protein [Prescottella equi]